MALKEHLQLIGDKMSMANTAGFILVISGMAIAYKMGETTLIQNLALIAAGYLFGSSKSKS